MSETTMSAAFEKAGVDPRQAQLNPRPPLPKRLQGRSGGRLRRDGANDC